MNLSTKLTQTHRCRTQIYYDQRVRRGGINEDTGIDIYTLLYTNR